MLLLFSVRLVRTGIERAHGAAFRQLLHDQVNLLGAATAGLSLAIVMQSSAAVAILSAGFLVSNSLPFPTALAIVIGGDLGSALVVQILSFPIGWIVSPLLALGGWLAVKSNSQKSRQYGRIIMGIALILVSLDFLRSAVEPVRDSSFLPAVTSYLQEDLITAFLIGAALAFILHSGVAAVLMIVALVQIDALPFEAGVAILLGANLGSGLIPVWLTRGMDTPVQRLVISNLGLRGALAIIFLLIVSALPLSEMAAKWSLIGAQGLILLHVSFNVVLLVVTLPFCGTIDKISSRLISNDNQIPNTAAAFKPASNLDPNTLGSPKLALTCLKQELLRMSSLVETMFRPALDMYLTDNDQLGQSIRDLDAEVDRCLAGIRSFATSIPKTSFKNLDGLSARDMLEYAIRLEAAGDVVAKRFTVLANQLHVAHSNLSKEGQCELLQMHENILTNFKLSADVLISADPESARLLCLEKAEIKRAERDSRKKHLQRLQNGRVESLETSNTHLETLRALREVNSHICAIAYPLLYKTGQLLETRLVHDAIGHPLQHKKPL
ncbi:Na/Pi cotransporter family protein [Ruegeria lacuscaerulensis]|uniref:Na/Pi cotransporter family protein n=1 Tax=Ruegeria lacuscaerulensis TaxID=55218 RepID=UPI0030140B79